MPRANRDEDTPPVRYPRTLFAHCHGDGNSGFPPLSSATVGEAFLELPDNWNGTDKIIIKFLGGETAADVLFNIVFNAGQDGEVFNVHTQTLANRPISCTLNEYTYEDVTAALAAFIALIAPNDTIWITITDTEAVSFYMVGVEIDET